eukprot:4629546-Amphidinium_carterae.1
MPVRHVQVHKAGYTLQHGVWWLDLRPGNFVLEPLSQASNVRQRCTRRSAMMAAGELRFRPQELHTGFQRV